MLKDAEIFIYNISHILQVNVRRINRDEILGVFTPTEIFNREAGTPVFEGYQWALSQKSFLKKRNNQNNSELLII
jgi:hypothetical protein